MVLFVVGLVVVVVLCLWGYWALSRPRSTDDAEPLPWDSLQAEEERQLRMQRDLDNLKPPSGSGL